MPAWLTYTLMRLGVFVGVFVVLLVLRIDWLWAAVIAAVVGLCVSFIFFRGQRNAMSAQWANRAPRRGRDEVAEDDELAAHGLIEPGLIEPGAIEPETIDDGEAPRSVREDRAES